MPVEKYKKRYPNPQGWVHPAFGQVLEVFRDSLAHGIDKGASFAAYYKGQLVVNIWGGFADEKAKREWTEDTVGNYHSCTKFMASVCCAHLVERGLLDYDEKVSKYWPEFSQNGKNGITITQLLSHKAGLAALSQNFLLKMMKDNVYELLRLLSRQTPLWEPGKHHGYSPIVTGIYLDELVKRVDPKGRSLSKYFDEEIAYPFGIDFHIGLPKHLFYRAARMEPQGNAAEVAAKKMENFQGDPEVLRLTSTQPSDWNSRWKLSDPEFASLPVPSSHGVGTARAAAKFAGIIANGGKLEDKTLLSANAIGQLQRPISIGRDISLSESSIYGLGTMLTPAKAGKQTWLMFGHSGFGGQNVMADSKFKIGWAYVTNYVDPSHTFSRNNRWRPLMEALYKCVFQLEGISEKFELLESNEEFCDLLKLKGKL